MEISKIFMWLAKFGGHILLYRLIIRFVFKYKILFYKVEEGHYMQYTYVRKGYKIRFIEFKEDDSGKKILVFKNINTKSV